MKKQLSEIQIKDIMTTNILACQPEDGVANVASTMVRHNFDGLPVVDKNHKLVGMVTMKELLNHEGEYLPTAIKILSGFKISHPDDVEEMEKKLQKVKKLKTESVMNRDPYYLYMNSSVQKAAEAFLLRREDPLPVVDSDKTLVGIVSKYDILKTLSEKLEPIIRHSGITTEMEFENIEKLMNKNFVYVSKIRMRFWYIALLTFLALGTIIALSFIIRIRIF